MRRRPDPVLIAAVAAGGALGAVSRWGVGEAVPTEPAGFPWATFGINLVGSFLLALLPAVPAVRRSRIAPAFLGPGVLGGFTTLSAYAEETRALLAADALAVAGLYVAGTLAGCLLAVTLASRIAGAPPGPQEAHG